MRKFTMLVAAACLLAAPFATAAECSGKVSRIALTEAARAGLAPALGERLHGVYSLSNGQRLRLLDYYGNLVAVFDQRQLVRLEEVAANRYASREGDVQLSWEPREDLIRLHYPADGQGRLLRACEG